MEIQKLNQRVRDKKRKLTVCLDLQSDFNLCNWAKSRGIINHYGTPNRSAAIEKLIELFTKDINYEKVDSSVNRSG